MLGGDCIVSALEMEAATEAGEIILVGNEEEETDKAMDAARGALSILLMIHCCCA
jgi:hypothetical protein